MPIAMFLEGLTVFTVASFSIIMAFTYFPRSLWGQVVAIGPTMLVAFAFEFVVNPIMPPSWRTPLFLSELVGVGVSVFFVRAVRLWRRRR